MARKYILEGEMVAKHVSREDLCKLLGLSYQSVLAKINGLTEFKCKEMFAIKQMLKTNKSLDELFSDEEV